MANSSIPLYRDDGSTQPYELQGSLFEVKSNGVAVITYNDEKTFHSLTQVRRVENFLMIEHVNRCPDIKVVVFTGAGQKAFCSGASLKGGDDHALEDDVFKEYLRRGMMPNLKQDIAMVADTRAFWDCKKPIIGAINGMAVGGGANIALCNYFDIVLASTNAKFKYPFASIGMTPELGSSYMFAFTAGMARAKQVMLTGDWFSVEQAAQWGLVNEVLAPDALLPRAMAMADQMADLEPAQLMLGKQVLNAEIRSRLDDILRRENETIKASLEDHGGREAFLKRIMAQQAKKQQSKM